jgi:hypothetical protein
MSAGGALGGRQDFQQARAMTTYRPAESIMMILPHQPEAAVHRRKPRENEKTDCQRQPAFVWLTAGGGTPAQPCLERLALNGFAISDARDGEAAGFHDRQQLQRRPCRRRRRSAPA